MQQDRFAPNRPDWHYLENLISALHCFAQKLSGLLFALYKYWQGPALFQSSGMSVIFQSLLTCCRVSSGAKETEFSRDLFPVCSLLHPTVPAVGVSYVALSSLPHP